MELNILIKKANKSQALTDSYCGQIVNELFSFYKKTLANEEEEDIFLGEIRCFICNDGMVLTDIDGNTVPVSIIKRVVSEKGYFDHQDFMDSRI